jgi:ribosomal protein L21E
MSRKVSDRPILWLTRQPQGLIPTTPYDLDYLERYRIGARVVCTIEQPRDAVLDRRFHGLIGTVAKATGDDPDSLKTRLMIRAGCFKSVDHIEGLGTSFSRRSVRELETPEFEDLFWRVVEIITTDFLPDIDREDLIEEINKYIGVRS